MELIERRTTQYTNNNVLRNVNVKSRVTRFTVQSISLIVSLARGIICAALLCALFGHINLSCGEADSVIEFMELCDWKKALLLGHIKRPFNSKLMWCILILAKKRKALHAHVTSSFTLMPFWQSLKEQMWVETLHKSPACCFVGWQKGSLARFKLRPSSSSLRVFICVCLQPAFWTFSPHVQICFHRTVKWALFCRKLITPTNKYKEIRLFRMSCEGILYSLFQVSFSWSEQFIRWAHRRCGGTTYDDGEDMSHNSLGGTWNSIFNILHTFRSRRLLEFIDICIEPSHRKIELSSLPQTSEMVRLTEHNAQMNIEFHISSTNYLVGCITVTPRLSRFSDVVWILIVKNLLMWFKKNLWFLLSWFFSATLCSFNIYSAFWGELASNLKLDILHSQQQQQKNLKKKGFI